MLGRLVIFLALNFGALALGSVFTGSGVTSDWYNGLTKAPWTPPGWVFGFAWTSIMICFSLYLAYLFPLVSNKKFLTSLFIVQWILNVGWNPLFFYFHQPILAFVVMLLLTAVVAYFLFNYWAAAKLWSILIVPYFVWLLIAASLNVYFIVAN